MRKTTIVLCSIVISIPQLANATLPSGVTFNGYLDGSYNYLVNNNRFISGSYDRVYDLASNGPTLHQAAGTFAYQPTAGFGGLANIIIGRDANITSAYGWNPDFVSPTLALDPYQLYLQYTTGPFTLIGGKFQTLIGYEALNPGANLNFSNSILSGFSEPNTLLGIRGNYVINEQVTLIAGVNNGWDNIRDFSRRKTIECSITYIPTPLFTAAINGIVGGQRAVDKTAIGPESIRYFIDAYTTYHLNQRIFLVASYDYGNQTLAGLPTSVGEGIWQGFAGYFNYQFNDYWQTAVRGEIFSDRNGYRTGVVQSWKELTLSVAYSVTKHFMLRAETRRDFSNANSFLTNNATGTSNYQQSYALEGYYSL